MSGLISVDLRDWCAANLRVNGDAFVFADGVRFDDVRAAVQAAWLAGEQQLALDLAQRYEVENVLCLCCARARSAGTRLCNMCHLDEIAAALWGRL